MRNIFVINPAAGKGKGIDKLIETIKRDSAELGIESEIYMTKSVGDAEVFARSTCMETTEEIRFYACGGDGTLNEVINGMYGFDHASCGCLPIGTGNDFVRVIKTDGDFMNIKDQLRGELMPCDLIEYTGKIEGMVQTRYCANMFNIGFDCNVVDLTAKLKTYPLLAGSFAYMLAVLIILIKKKGENLKIEVDGEVKEDGPVLLCAVANGSYCGGGVYSSPQASISDGHFDTNIIYDVSRVKFIKLFPSYQKGTHFSRNDIDEVINAMPCTTTRITPNNGIMRLCTDGEIKTAEAVEMKMVAEAIKIVVPRKA